MYFYNEKVTMLLVDDKTENLFSLLALLEQPDRVFLRATSGEEALRLALKSELALILLDVHMPDMDGFEVAKWLKSNPKTKYVPILFVTAANRDVTNMLKGYAEGGMDFIFKPLDPDLVRAKVDSFVRFYRLQKELERARENEKIHLKTIEEGEITYRQLIGSAPDAIVVIDENSTITQWNGQAEGMFGWKNGQVIGESLVSLLIPERYRAMHIQGLLHFLETGEGPVLNKPIAVMALQKNGMEIPVEIKISVSKVNGKNSFTAFIRDISERKISDQKGRNELLTNDQ